MYWNDDRIARLKAMHLEEGLSMSQIARALGDGVTRNAVLGKIHRLGLSGQGRPNGGGHAMHARKVAKVDSPRGRKGQNVSAADLRAKRAELRMAARADEPTPLLDAEGQPITLITATSRMQCRWMPGDHKAGDLQICAHPTAPNESWCPHHAGRVKNATASALAREAATNKVPTLKERALSRAIRSSS